MKVFRNLASLVLALASVAMVVSCGDGKNQNAAAGNDSTAVKESPMTIRYINEDSVLAQYNLAKDINEAMLRRSNQFDSEQTRRARDIQKFATDCDNKLRSNGYLSQESLNADQNKLVKMQSDAENYLAKLQRDIQNEMVQNQIQLNDSIDNFLVSYCKENGIDAVLRKTASFYMDPKYEITKEVVDGLNKRYNKVKK